MINYKTNNDTTKKTQKYLGDKGFIVFIAFLGAFILTFLSWRGVFVVLTIIGGISVLGSFAMEETIDSRSERSVFKTIGRAIFNYWHNKPCSLVSFI
ncbi:MAG: hypothetical protein AB6733_00465 [Clostridiaceae bacterium]